MSDINEMTGMLKRNRLILELGSSPGSWTQLLLKVCVDGTKILSIDREPMEALPEPKKEIKLKIYQGDVFDEESEAEVMRYFENHKIDLILSDMAPNITGEAFIDSDDILELNQRTLELASKVLRSKGEMLVKTFKTSNEKLNFEVFQLLFQNVQRIKPASSKSRSSELFYYCKGFNDTKFLDYSMSQFHVSVDMLTEFCPELKNINEDQRESILACVVRMTAQMQRKGIQAINLRSEIGHKTEDDAKENQTDKILRKAEEEKTMDK